MNTKLLTRRIFTRMPVRIVLIAGMLSVLGSCGRQIPSAPRILKEGDQLNGMVVTSGTADATRLEYFCTFEVDEEVTTSIDCQVPPVQKLAIGHLVGVTGGALQELDWSEIDWQVYLDGYLLDLDTFDDQSYVEPVILSSPSPIREVFKQRHTWDIMLINPGFGLHTLRCTTKTKAVVYNWVVNFMINSTRGPVDAVDRLIRSTPDILGIRDQPAGHDRRY
jgi:hypothetical protein